VYLKCTGYSEAKYLLSCKSLDIISYLVHGLVGLVLVYCDHFDTPIPLLPWLHSTETCEHIFGEACKIVKDFTMLDFFYMLTKLRVKLCEAVCKLFILNVNISHSEMHSSQSLPEDDVDKEEAEEAYASECHEIRKAISLTITIPLLHLHDKLSCPFGQANLLPESLDLSSHYYAILTPDATCSKSRSHSRFHCHC
jgi:hypothetical protein